MCSRGRRGAMGTICTRGTSGTTSITGIRVQEGTRGTRGRYKVLPATVSIKLSGADCEQLCGSRGAIQIQSSRHLMVTTLDRGTRVQLEKGGQEVQPLASVPVVPLVPVLPFVHILYSL